MKQLMNIFNQMKTKVRYLRLLSEKNSLCELVKRNSQQKRVDENAIGYKFKIRR